MPSRLFDPGLQPERTALAWRRTSLGIAVASLVALRVLPSLATSSEGGLALMTPGVVGAIFAVVLWELARQRSRDVDLALGDVRSAPLPGGGLLFALASFTIGCGAFSAALVAVLLISSER